MFKWNRILKVTKNKNTYNISAYVNNVLIWVENEILLQSVLKYGFTVEQLPQKENEVKFYNAKLYNE